MVSKWFRRERLFQIIRYDPHTGEQYSDWLLASSQAALRHMYGLSDDQKVIHHKWATVEVNYDDDIYFIVKTDDGNEWQVHKHDSNYQHFCQILAGPIGDIRRAIQKDFDDRYGSID